MSDGRRVPVAGAVEPSEVVGEVEAEGVVQAGMVQAGMMVDLDRMARGQTVRREGTVIEGEGEVGAVHQVARHDRSPFRQSSMD